jgi:hypothetical protein
MKPVLKALGTKRLKLQYDETLSNFAFKFNLRRYTLVAGVRIMFTENPYLSYDVGVRQGLTLVHFSAERKRFL